MSNTFRQNETVVVDVELEGIDTFIPSSGVAIKIESSTGYTIIPDTEMDNLGNQKYRYFWDTRSGFTGTSGWSSWSAYAGVSGGPVTYSGYSGNSGFSTGISGLYTTTITARDSNNHYGYEEFKIRIG
jgi:hypothetical protein